MTVDRSWMQYFKETCPRAFSADLPSDNSIKTVFIDGQLLLQGPGAVKDWQTWLQTNYIRPINRYLARPGIDNVVLAFDDHTFTPLAKGPTQAKRRSRSEIPSWEPHRPLPEKIPENYDTLLFNRNFKARVIQFVVDHAFRQVRFSDAAQRLVIDYTEVFFFSKDSREIITPLEVKANLGECDVKFVRYLKWGPILLAAVDSDYVVIALCQLEKSARESRGEPVHPIYVRRLIVREKQAPSQSRAKRAREDGACEEDTAHVKESSRPRREYEIVNCATVFDHIRPRLVRITPDHLHESVFSLLSYFIALCGSDFTRGISWVTAKSITKNLSYLWPALCSGVTLDAATSAPQVDARTLADKVVGRLWRQDQHRKSLGGFGSNAPFESIYNHLLNDRAISLFRRERLISPEELHCLVRNCNWTVQYWLSPEKCPGALDGPYGYRRERNQKVVFDMQDPLP